MNFYVVNIFHEDAAAFCTAILEKGLEVCAVGLSTMDAFDADEEMIWMDFGRNANLTYAAFEELLQESDIDTETKILYFPFQNERHSKFLRKLGEWNVPVYMVSGEERVMEERIENFTLISDDVEQFAQKFLQAHFF